MKILKKETRTSDYIYADMKAGTIYTNQKRLENFQELDNNLKLLRKTGKYVIVKSKLKDFKTNLRSEIAEAWRDEIKNTGIQKKDFVFAGMCKYKLSDCRSLLFRKSAL